MSHPAPVVPALQLHGCACGPDNTGPDCGWSVIVIDELRRPRALATRSLVPSRSPVTKPSNCRFWRTANSRVMSLPFRVTDTNDGAVPAGNVTVTNASPPDTRSALVESTLIRRAGGRARAATGG